MVEPWVFGPEGSIRAGSGAARRVGPTDFISVAMWICDATPSIRSASKAAPPRRHLSREQTCGSQAGPCASGPRLRARFQSSVMSPVTTTIFALTSVAVVRPPPREARTPRLDQGNSTSFEHSRFRGADFSRLRACDLAPRATLSTPKLAPTVRPLIQRPRRDQRCDMLPIPTNECKHEHGRLRKTTALEARSRFRIGS